MNIYDRPYICEEFYIVTTPIEGEYEIGTTPNLNGLLRRLAVNHPVILKTHYSTLRLPGLTSLICTPLESRRKANNSFVLSEPDIEVIEGVIRNYNYYSIEILQDTLKLCIAS